MQAGKTLLSSACFGQSFSLGKPGQLAQLEGFSTGPCCEASTGKNTPLWEGRVEHDGSGTTTTAPDGAWAGQGGPRMPATSTQVGPRTKTTYTVTVYYAPRPTAILTPEKYSLQSSTHAGIGLWLLRAATVGGPRGVMQRRINHHPDRWGQWVGHYDLPSNHKNHRRQHPRPEW